MNPWQSRRWKLANRRIPALAEFVVKQSFTLYNNLSVAYNFETYAGGKYVAAFPSASYDISGVGSPSASSGKIGNAANLTAANSYGGLLALFDAPLFTGSYSICFWVYAVALPGSNVDLVSCLSGSNGYAIRLSPAGVVTFLSGTGSVYESVVSSEIISDSLWYLVCATRTGSQLKISVSDEGLFKPFDVAASAAYAHSSGATFTINRLGGVSVSCYMDSLFMWNRSLAESEFNLAYNSSVGRSYPS